MHSPIRFLSTSRIFPRIPRTIRLSAPPWITSFARGTGNENAKVLLGSLTADDDALLKVDREITDPADAIVVVAPETLYPVDSDVTASDKTEIESQTAIYTQMFSQIASRGATVGYGRAF